MRDPWIKLTFAIGLAIGLFLGGFTAWRLVSEGSRLTAPRRLHWAGGGPFPPCVGDDGLRSARWGDRLVLACSPSADLPPGGYALLRPDQGTAALAWPLPDALPLQRTEGLQPGPSGQLAIVYRTARGALALGVAGPDGWQRPPEALPFPEEAVLLGMSWDEHRIAVVASGPVTPPAPEGWNGPRVVTLDDGPPQTRDFSPDALCDPSWLRCQVEAAMRQPGARVWRFLVAAGEPAALWTVVETGVRHVLQGVDFPWDARDDVDLSAAGLVIGNPLRLQAAWSQEGELEPLTLQDRADFAGWSQDYQVDPGARLSWRHQYVLGDSAVMLQPPHGQTVGLEVATDHPTVLLAYRLVSPHLRAEGRVGRLTPDCTGLTRGILMEQPDGGFYAVSTGGCELHIGPDAGRADPLSLFEHLRRRGSTCGDCDAWGLPWLLGWVLLGLPISLGGAWLWLRRLRNRERQKALEPLVLTVAVLFYDVLAGALLSQLLPVLGL